MKQLDEVATFIQCLSFSNLLTGKTHLTSYVMVQLTSANEVQHQMSQSPGRLPVLSTTYASVGYNGRSGGYFGAIVLLNFCTYTPYHAIKQSIRKRSKVCMLCRDGFCVENRFSHPRCYEVPIFGVQSSSTGCFVQVGIDVLSTLCTWNCAAYQRSVYASPKGDMSWTCSSLGPCDNYSNR